MNNLDIKSLENEAKEINRLIKKIEEAKTGTYFLSEEDAKRAIILSNIKDFDNMTNKVISIGSTENNYTITIEKKMKEISYL